MYYFCNTSPVCRGVTRFRYCDVTDGDVLEVYVTNVVSPSEFYCQLAPAATELPLFEDKLVDQYRCNEQVLARVLRPGDACVVLNDASWFRACVTRSTDDEAHVFYVDYGNSGVVARYVYQCTCLVMFTTF